MVNRVSGHLFDKLGSTIDDVMDEVGLLPLGIVPEDLQVTLAAAQGTALVLQTQKGAAVACLHRPALNRQESPPHAGKIME